MDKLQISTLAGTVDSASRSLYRTMEYIYMISAEDFYGVNVKDIFRIALSDVSNTDNIVRLGLKLNPALTGDLASPDFKRSLELFRYAFAIRMPFLLRQFPQKRALFDEAAAKELYAEIIALGAENFDGIVPSDFKQFLRAAKGKDDEPDFDTEWWKRWIYAYGKDFAVINNRNMFFLGCTDALFPLYYSALCDKLLEIIQGWIK